MHTSREIAQAMVDRAFAQVRRYPRPVPVLDEHGDEVKCEACRSVATVLDYDQFGFCVPLCAAHATENPREDVVSFALSVLP